MRPFSLILLLCAIVLIAADPAKRTRRDRSADNRRQYRMGDFDGDGKLDPDSDLERCLEELVQLYTLHEKGQYTDKRMPKNSQVHVDVSQRYKAIVTNVIETLRRARIGHDESCDELESVIGAQISLGDSIRAREARKKHQDDAQKMIRAANARRPGKKAILDEDYVVTEEPNFEYMYYAGNGATAKSCTSCACMLSLQSTISSGQVVDLQAFHDNSVVVAKQEDIQLGTIDNYYFFFSGDRVIRIEHYRTTTKPQQ